MDPYTSHPSGEDADQVLLKHIRRYPDKSIHLDILADIVRSEWPTWYNSEPKRNRHWIRNRLQSLKDMEENEQGKIGNPKLSYYCQPKPKNPLTNLDWEEVWDEFLENAKKAKTSQTKFVGYNGKYIVEISELKMKNNEPNIVLRGEKVGDKPDFSESNFREAIIRLNTVAGRMQRPRKSLSKNVILVGLVKRLEFDDEDYVIVTKKEFDPKREFEDLGPDDKEKFVKILEDPKAKKPKTKGKRTVSTLVREARQRSKGKSELRESRKRNFDLDEEWINEKSKLTHCEVTGIKFTQNFASGPFARSLDCRNPDLDYTKENVDVVVSIYNLAKNKWPPEVVEEFCIEWYKNLDQ